MLPRLVTYNTYMRSFQYNTYMRSFQYKFLNNVPFHNKKLYTFGIKPFPLCSLCNLYDKTPLHIFYECDKCLWADLVQCFQNNLILPTLTPQATIFGILESSSMTPFLKTKYLSITFYLYLSCMCLSPEKKSS